MLQWKKPEEYVYNSTRNLFYFHSTSKSLMRNNSSNLLKQVIPAIHYIQ